jgi:hypothetical protein
MEAIGWRAITIRRNTAATGPGFTGDTSIRCGNFTSKIRANPTDWHSLIDPNRNPTLRVTRASASPRIVTEAASPGLAPPT